MKAALLVERSVDWKAPSKAIRLWWGYMKQDCGGDDGRNYI